MKGEKYLLKGHIIVDSSVTQLNLPESIVVDVLDNGNNFVDGTIARLLPDQNDEANAAVYEYSVWVTRGQKVTFVPTDSRYLSHSMILVGFTCSCLWLEGSS